MTRRTRTRIIYRDRPSHLAGYFSAITVGQIKQWLTVMVPIAFGFWAFAGPYVDAKAEELLKSKLIEIGMDPATVQALNKNLIELQENVKKKEESTSKLADDVNELKVDLGKVLILLEQQQRAIQGEAVK